jgi:RNA polymerase sigma-70 factor (ECF subfamily)
MENAPPRYYFYKDVPARHRAKEEVLDDLMERFQSGDEEAFSEIVRTFKDRLFRHIQGFLRDPAESEDVLQDLFLRLYRVRTTYQPRQRLEAFLYRIASNLCKDRLRRTKALPGLDTEAVASSTPGPAVQAESRDILAQISQAIRSLPLNQQTVLNLVTIEGKSYQETCGIMDLPLPAVKSLLFRARTNLKKRIGPQLS